MNLSNKKHYKLTTPSKMNIKKEIILLILIVSFVSVTFSQTNNNSFSAWFSAELNYKLNKKWTFSIQEQLRLKEDASVTDSYFTQLGAEYALTKRIDVAVNYRYIKKNDNKGDVQGYNSFGRLQFDLVYGHKIDDFLFKHRFRYQTKNQLGISDNANNQIRFKTSVGYNIKRWKLDPKFSAEIFNRMGADNASKNGLNKYRLTLGTSYNTKNIGRFGLFYRIEKEINKTFPETERILGLRYSYTIKKKKRN